MNRWEAFGGVLPIVVGKRRNGKPHTILMMQVLVCMTEADAKAVSKVHPSLKFRRKGRAMPTKGKER